MKKINLVSKIAFSSVFSCSSMAAEQAHDSHGNVIIEGQMNNVIDLGNGNQIHLNDSNLDTLLTNMRVGGKQGRYGIGGSSIESASQTIEKILHDDYDMDQETLKRFLICVSAQMKVENGDALYDVGTGTPNHLKENFNVIYSRGAEDTLQGFIGQNRISIKIKDLMTAYRLLKINAGNLSAASQIPLIGNNLFETTCQLSKPILNGLKNNGQKFSFVQMTPENRIPYLLLKKNASGKYEFPTISTQGSCIDNTQSSLQTLGNVDVSQWANFEDFDAPAAITVAHPSLDQKILSYYHQQTTNLSMPDFVFIRACNLAALTSGMGQSSYYGLNNSNELFAKWAHLDLILEPSVLVGMNAFTDLRGFMYRVRGVDLSEIANNWLPPLPSENISAGNAPVIHSASQNQNQNSGNISFTPIAMSVEQITAIQGLYHSVKDKLKDPTRPGVEFEDLELTIAAAILQVVPNSQNGYMTGLCLVFSYERAKAILDKIIEG